MISNIEVETLSLYISVWMSLSYYLNGTSSGLNYEVESGEIVKKASLTLQCSSETSTSNVNHDSSRSFFRAKICTSPNLEAM